MNKVGADLIRNILKIGGAALATSGIIDGAQCSITDPKLASISGIVVTMGAMIWGLVNAQKHEELKQDAAT